jgi:trans-4-hydroxy-L-proline dehydratase
MTDRIKILREQSLKAEARISAERALLVTEFYQTGRGGEFPYP